MIHNLSDHTLTEDEFSILTKDLSLFPPPPKSLNKKLLNPGISSRHACQDNVFFRNNIHDKPLPFKRKSNWIPPPSDNHTLVDFFTRIERELTSINIPCQKTYSNRALQEKAPLKNHKNNQTHCHQTMR